MSTARMSLSGASMTRPKKKQKTAAGAGAGASASASASTGAAAAAVASAGAAATAAAGAGSAGTSTGTGASAGVAGALHPPPALASWQKGKRFFPTTDTYGDWKLPTLPDSYVPWSKLYVYDAGFGSIPLAVALFRMKVHFILAVKTAYRYSPLKDMQAHMANKPSGTRLFAKTNIDGADLVFAAYRYNSKKTLFFVFSKGAGSTADGQPYVASYRDKRGMHSTREVRRPSVISRYFFCMPRIDSHNQMRQKELALEKKWVPKGEGGCWFRIFTTILGMTTTDAHLMAHHSALAAGKDKWCKGKCTTRKHLKMLVKEMIDESEDFQDEEAKEDTDAPRSTVQLFTTPSTSSSSSSSSSCAQLHKLKHLGQRKQKIKGTGKVQMMPIQKTCAICGKKTTTGCTVCIRTRGGRNFPLPICRDYSGKNKDRLCHAEHLIRVRK